jgi:xylan 1,4-beta-xylosidase
MKRKFAIIGLIILFVVATRVQRAKGQTYCNPINLSYPRSSTQNTGIDITDPTVVLFKDNYYLFASKAGGYWVSGDLISWKFVVATNLPLANQGPTAIVIGDWMYFFTSLSSAIYRSANPEKGIWEVYNDSFSLSTISDLTVFADTDGKVYCYYGCSNHSGLMARELDPKNKLNPKGVPKICLLNTPLKKRTNKSADKSNTSSIAGSWMNKYNGKYYYQSTETSTSIKNTSEVVYTSDSPFGPFSYAPYNPIASRPDGFLCGIGYGSTFADKYGNWWHITTMTTPGNRIAENRFGLFPAGFDKDGNLFTKTEFGDYPFYIPNKIANNNKPDPEWRLISGKCMATASSEKVSNPVAFAFDENLETSWRAVTGRKGEWMRVDLGSPCTINAVQINFAGIKKTALENEQKVARQYLVEYSADQKNWITMIDKTNNTDNLMLNYQEISTPVVAQFIKVTNYLAPDSVFAIAELRVFGIGTGHKPDKVITFHAAGDSRNKQLIKLKWEKSVDATGYIIRYGPEKNKLYHSYQVFKNTPVIINCLDKGKVYWFQIDAFNENGVTPGNCKSYP